MLNQICLANGAVANLLPGAPGTKIW